MRGRKLQTSLFALSSVSVIPILIILIGWMSGLFIPAIWVPIMLCLVAKSLVNRGEILHTSKLSKEHCEKVTYLLWQIMPSLTLLLLTLIHLFWGANEVNARTYFGLKFLIAPFFYFALFSLFPFIRISSKSASYLARLPGKLVMLLLCFELVMVDQTRIRNVRAETAKIAMAIQEECRVKRQCPVMLDLPNLTSIKKPLYQAAHTNSYAIDINFITKIIRYELHYSTNQEQSSYGLWVSDGLFSSHNYAGSVEEL